MPAISVILPVFNSEKYLKEAIDSILQQTYSDFELLIYNDGSTDKSHDIITSYKDQRIIYTCFEQNIGYVHLLNKGLDNARGKYIARMDADDIALPNRFEEQIVFLENNKSISICGTWFEHIGSITGVVKLATSVDEIRSRLFYGTPLCHPAVMMNKDHLDRFGLRYDPNFYYAEDYDFFERASLNLHIVNLPKVLLKYRKHKTQITNTKWQVQYMLAGKVQARRLLRVLGIPSEHDNEWFKNFFTYKSTPNQTWLEEVELYKKRLFDKNEETNSYPHNILNNAVTELFDTNIFENFSKHYHGKYYLASRHNIPLLKSFIFDQYKPYKFLGLKLTFFFIIKCLLGFNK